MRTTYVILYNLFTKAIFIIFAGMPLLLFHVFIIVICVKVCIFEHIRYFGNCTQSARSVHHCLAKGYLTFPCKDDVYIFVNITLLSRLYL